MPPAALPHRRRLYLMRHGAVDYFAADGTPVPPAQVSLNAAGHAQAQAAGALLAQAGVRLDLVLTSGLRRTVETAGHVLQALGQDLPIHEEPALAEIRPGRLADLPRDGLEAAFLQAFAAGPEDAGLQAKRFLGGESIGEMLARVAPAADAWLARADWDCALWVLHGGVNRAVLARALTGRPGFIGGLEQSPACLNVLDIGPRDMIVRATNLTPTDWIQAGDRLTTMEHLYAQYAGRTAP